VFGVRASIERGDRWECLLLQVLENLRKSAPNLGTPPDPTFFTLMLLLESALDFREIREHIVKPHKMFSLIDKRKPVDYLLDREGTRGVDCAGRRVSGECEILTWQKKGSPAKCSLSSSRKEDRCLGEMSRA